MAATKTSAKKPAAKKPAAKKPAAKKPASSVNSTEEVNAFMSKLEHPLKAEMEAVRAIILNANSKLAERIKWNAPSFFYKKDMAVFHPRARDCVHIVFVFYDGAMISDTTGLLEGDYKDRRMVKLRDMADVRARKATLEKVVNQWVALMDR